MGSLQGEKLTFLNTGQLSDRNTNLKTFQTPKIGDCAKLFRQVL